MRSTSAANDTLLAFRTKPGQWLAGLTGIVCALTGYLLLSADTDVPPDRLNELLVANPEMAQSLSVGSIALLEQSESALSAAQKALATDSANENSKENPDSQPAAVPSHAWRQSTLAAPPSMPLSSGVTLYEQVEIDMETPVFPSPGEQVSFALPGNLNVVVNVETAITNPNGDYTWRGHLEGQGTDYPVVMTYGGASVFATITTPEGSYTMESIDGSGWVYKNPSEFELSRAGANDYLEIPSALHEY